MKTNTPLQDYLFDLRGFLLLEKALNPSEVAELNASLDTIPPIKRNEWHGYVHREDHHDSRGISYQQIYENGKPWENLIDHPSWISHVLRYVGGEGTFDYNHGPLFIDENFANIRGSGESIALHSGGHEGTKRTQFKYHNSKFHCGQINILMALTDIGPGDGGTMVIPGSHKANFEHPRMEEIRKNGLVGSLDHVEGAIEVHMKAGDALLFVDAISHGSAKRVNPGQRRIAVYRYGPSWGNFRWGYLPSKELLARLTPYQRKIVNPQEYRCPPVALNSKGNGGAFSRHHQNPSNGGLPVEKKSAEPTLATY